MAAQITYESNTRWRALVRSLATHTHHTTLTHSPWIWNLESGSYLSVVRYLLICGSSICALPCTVAANGEHGISTFSSSLSHFLHSIFRRKWRRSSCAEHTHSNEIGIIIILFYHFVSVWCLHENPLDAALTRRNYVYLKCIKCQNDMRRIVQTRNARNANNCKWSGQNVRNTI